MPADPARPRLRDGVHWWGLSSTILGLVIGGYGAEAERERKYLASAVVVKDIQQLLEHLQDGRVHVPCNLALLSGRVTAPNPFLNTKVARCPVVMTRTTTILESVNPGVTGHTLVRSTGRSEYKLSSIYVADKETALPVSHGVNVLEVPWIPAGYTRQVCHRSPILQVLVTAVNALFNRQTTLAIVTEEAVLPVNTPVQVVGQLTSVEAGRSTGATPWNGKPKLSTLCWDPTLKTYCKRVKPPRGTRILAISPNGPSGIGPSRVTITGDLHFLKSKLRVYALASSVFGFGLYAVGCFFVVRKLWRQWKRRKDYDDAMADARAAAAAQDDDPGGPDDRNQDECVICMSRRRNAAFPCGHMVTCLACGMNCDSCPYCRRRGRIMRIYR